MKNNNTGIEIPVKSRLLKRLARIADLKTSEVNNKDLNRSLLITTHVDGLFKTESVDFKQLDKFTNEMEFFPGYFQEKTHTISSLAFSLSDDLSCKFESMYSNIIYWTSQFNSESKSKTFIIPLSHDIFEQQTLDKLLDAINFQVGCKINITFDTASFNPTLHFIKLHNPILHKEGDFLDVANTIKRHKNQLQQSSGQKNIKKLKQLKEGLYKVNRFNNEAEASDRATQKNVSFLDAPEALKAPYTLKQVTKYSETLEVAAQMALGLGIKEKYLKEIYKGQHTSSTFSCLVNEGNDAVVYINRNVESKYFGKLGYKSLSTGDRFTMAELYTKLLSPDEEVNKPTLMALQMKLLDEIGLLKTESSEIQVPKDLTPKQISVLHGFHQLLRLKQSVKGQEGDPILFTYSFASMWCGVSRITATTAIKKLVSSKIIYIADQAKHLVSYLFTKIKTAKELLEESIAQTKVVKAFICDDIKDRYRKNKGYEIPKARVNKTTMCSLENIGDKYVEYEREGDRKQKGAFAATKAPKKINFRQAILLKKMLPQ
tara:strand:+ start:2902 stop:4533 length:1632 start_codon:yes stop_codon:yes gene_type:complete